MDDRTSDETTRNRWLAIQVARFAGIALILIGVLMHEGRFGGEKAVAYLLIGVGMIDVFVMPRLLARRWRSPRE